MDFLSHLHGRLEGNDQFAPESLELKQNVRSFAQAVGVKHPEVYFQGPLAELPTSLPNEFVLKPDFASTSIGVFLLESLTSYEFKDLVHDVVITRAELVDRCNAVVERFREKSGGSTVFIVEELLRAPDGSTPPPDIRCYTFQGEIGMILMEHHITGDARAMYFDGNFHPFVDVQERYGIAESARVREAIEPATTPAIASDLLAVARRLSVAVPSAFVRVDLYSTNKGIYLGELTLFPGTFYYENRKLMFANESARLGRLWDAAIERLRGSQQIN